MLRGDARDLAGVVAMELVAAVVKDVATEVVKELATPAANTVANTHVNHSVLVHNVEGGKPNKIHLACAQVR